MTNDERFEWLLKAASQASRKPNEEPPFGLETRVLAQWRAGLAEDESAVLFAFFRRAMVVATLALLLSASWSLTRPSDVSGDEAAMGQYEFQAGLTP